MTDEGHYYTRSLALLCHDRGWIKPLLVMAAANCVPIVGLLGNEGYAAEWARLIAWGVDAAPKQRKVRIGSCISAGWRAFVGSVWVLLAVTAIQLGFEVIFKGSFSDILNVLLAFVSSFVVILAALHATIYHDYKAGWQVRRLWSLVKTNHKGVLRVITLNACLYLIFVFLAAIVWIALGFYVVANLSAGFSMLGYQDVMQSMKVSTVLYYFAGIFRSLAAHAVPVAIIMYLTSLGAVFTHMIKMGAVALWLRQFDVASWQESNQVFVEKEAPERSPSDVGMQS